MGDERVVPPARQAVARKVPTTSASPVRVESVEGIDHLRSRIGERAVGEVDPFHLRQSVGRLDDDGRHVGLWPGAASLGGHDHQLRDADRSQQRRCVRSTRHPSLRRAPPNVPRRSAASARSTSRPSSDRSVLGVIEIMTFRLRGGVDESVFRDVDGRVQVEFAYQQPGLLRRTLGRRGDRVARAAGLGERRRGGCRAGRVRRIPARRRVHGARRQREPRRRAVRRGRVDLLLHQHERVALRILDRGDRRPGGHVERLRDHRSTERRDAFE